MKEVLRGAFVIARRDFSATTGSRSFFLFLLGPLFPVLMVFVFGAATGDMTSDAEHPVVAVVWNDADFRALSDAGERLDRALDRETLITLQQFRPRGDPEAQRNRLLESDSPPIIAVVEGTLDDPRLVGSVSENSGTVRLTRYLIDSAQRVRSDPDMVEMELRNVRQAAGALAPARAITARISQTILFLLTILLSGMLLSQMVEEKSNKIIEVLAAAIPIDAIFLGKLFAMLLMSLVGIAVWAGVGAVVLAVLKINAFAELPRPAVGWTAFFALFVVYFSMSYLLLGALFLGIGAQASTVREVQILSMPITMAQVLLFALASGAVGNHDSSIAAATATFPWSSPFVMIARAAELPQLWPHLLAIAWQLFWVGLILALASRLFRKSVLKSGPQKRRRFARS